MGQEITISGQVKDQQGLPLPGVSVRVKNSNLGVSTESNGTFKLKAKADAILTFSFIGFKAIEEPVNNRTTLTITLSEDDNKLNEVIVVGYGTTTKKDLTTAVVSVSSKDLENQPITNPLQAIQEEPPGFRFLHNLANQAQV
ncbi:carboxypeptidase-like regulatory domain-containing protein [Pedobacter sp. SL55]|nr:carboxypeptidase-like regulatory domain-containing protein [Pedobacter sp. SL55]